MKKLFLLALSLTFAMPVLAQNHAPNPYRAVPDVWGELPEGRSWGSTSAVYPAADGNIWVAERCGENTCVGHDDLDPILLFDVDGNLLRSFGAGMFEWPHGIHVDPDGNLWVTDARGGEGRGHQIHKFTPEGELMMSLGQAGVAGDGPDTFDAAGSSSATARTTACRSSTRTATTSTPGPSSAGPAGSSSTPTTCSIPPTPSPPPAAASPTPAGCAASASAAWWTGW